MRRDPSNYEGRTISTNLELASQMPNRSKAQHAHISGLAAVRKSQHAQSSSVVASPIAKTRPKTRRQAQEDLLHDLIRSQELRINELEANLQTANTHARHAEHLSSQLREKAAEIILLETFRIETEEELRQAQLAVETAHSSLDSTRANAMSLRKRIRRLEREKSATKVCNQSRIRELKTEHEKKLTEILGHTTEANTKMESLSASLQRCMEALSNEKNVTTTLRTRLHTLDMQRRRTQKKLSDARQRFRLLSTWKTTRHGTYTPEARSLVRALLSAGCAGDRIGDAIRACAKAFKVRVTRVLGRRTAFRARDEGGHYGLMQLGREIAHSKGAIFENRLTFC